MQSVGRLSIETDRRGAAPSPRRSAAAWAHSARRSGRSKGPL